MSSPPRVRFARNPFRRPAVPADRLPDPPADQAVGLGLGEVGVEDEAHRFGPSAFEGLGDRSIVGAEP